MTASADGNGAVDYAVTLTAHELGTEISPTAALEKFAVSCPDAVGFVYTPSAAPWFRMTDGRAKQRDGSTIPEDAFELRAFAADRELRWYRTSDFDLGRAVVLTEEPTSGAPTADSAHPLRPKQTRSLLLWGAATGKYNDGWAQVRTGRIGHLWFPLATQPEKGSQLALAVIDYVTRDHHGNVGVVDQRLTGVEAR
ncbi:CRISPR-associated protein Csx19 [Skermania piniformis]|uniref:Uncharacterized protein n=1 Tax=Skermania pinensis TaxID=39122 RepID=A0ABX8SDJ0_9ACTN|nr:CRISPR-associated protein Csx19 [Skermania piniformis]QXQ14505.1 hypothetical protein KV203_03610 [Skermania piniformis]